MSRLEVKTSKLPLVLTVFLGLLFVPLSVLSLAVGLSKGFSVVPVVMGFVMLALYGVIILLVRRGHAKSVKYFSSEGLERNDGTRFVWADLHRVVDQVRIMSRAHNTKSLWRTEIQFKSGETAWLIPTKVQNFREVSEFVHGLPCERVEKIV